MALTLIGGGVAYDLTISGIDALKACDEAFIETYTNPTDASRIEAIERMSGKKITLLERSLVEGPYLADKAMKSDICLIASGDPLTATTHITLVMEARAKGVRVKVIHNSSIYSVAPARSGLQIYRFGKTATLVNPRKNYKPTSSLDLVRENRSRNCHSLVLLDTEPEPMDAKTALTMLAEFGECVVLSRVGLPDERITYGKIVYLEKKDLGKPPFTVIVPAKLHPVELEYLKSL